MTSRDDNRRFAEAYADVMGSSASNLPTESTHEYAACQASICALCDAYGDGYSVGREKAYFEVRKWHPKQHAPSCGCNPCMAARSVLGKVTL